jgi:drug/metabolite transporter (DMT)-like permease
VITFLLVNLIIAGAVVVGLTTSWRRRHADRRRFAEFVGFSSAAIAFAATTLCWVVADLRTHSSPTWQGFLFIAGIIAIGAIVVSFVACFFSQGKQRLALFCCGIMIAFMYLLGLVSHFGD